MKREGLQSHIEEKEEQLRLAGAAVVPANTCYLSKYTSSTGQLEFKPLHVLNIQRIPVQFYLRS